VRSDDITRTPKVNHLAFRRPGNAIDGAEINVHLLAGGHGDALAFHDRLSVLHDLGPHGVIVFLARLQLGSGKGPDLGGQRAQGIVHEQFGIRGQANRDACDIVAGRRFSHRRNHRLLSNYHGV